MFHGSPWKTWLYLLPAGVFLIVFLVYPTVTTVYLSFFNRDSTEFVGSSNYIYLFSHKDTLVALRNNLLWLTLFTAVTVAIGLLAAVLTDRVSYGSLAKAIIFIPMAVSFTAAAVIWRFMYQFQAEGVAQTGLVNATLVALGVPPVAWLFDPSINNFAIIAAGVWIWTGFATVILSAGLKGIPTEIIEAARIDGAQEWQIFHRIILPMLLPIILVVTVTLVINALKVFDLVYVITFGNFDTDVLANRMYKEMFTFGHFGRASAIAVILLLAIIPIMLANLRRFRREEGQ
jgi:alpha-glucoside transport system permease protein